MSITSAAPTRRRSVGVMIARPIVQFFIAMTSKWYWVVLAYAVTRVIAIFVFVYIEHWRPQEAYWWGEVSSLTIGYGDFAPKTDLGRFIAGPFQFFWVYYCGLALGGHIIKFLFRNMHELTHQEQEWLFRVIGIIFDWVRWIVVALQKIAAERGIELDPLPHRTADGLPVLCPPQAPDTDYESEIAESST